MFNIADHLNTHNCFIYGEYYREIAQMPNIYKIAEVGVWKGHSISFFVQEALAAGKNNIHAWAIDSWKPTHQTYNKFPEMPFIKDIFLENIKNNKLDKYITPIQDESHLGANYFEDGFFDFVYIDADHRYEYTKRDVLAWIPKIRKGGIIAGHDYLTIESERDEPDVKMAVDELVNTGVLKNLHLRQGNVWHSDII